MTFSDTINFLSIVLGEQVASHLSKPQRTYLAYIQIQAERLPRGELQDLLANRNDSAVSVSVDEVFTVLKGISQCANSTAHFGIDKAIDYLVEIGTLNADVLHSEIHAKARNILYIMISWICMLYSSADLEQPYRLQMNDDQNVNLNIARRDISDAEYSICELIQRFGSLLPVKSPPSSQSSVDVVDALYVSLLNANTLFHIGEIKIQWVNNISAHFTLDRERRCLRVFGLPSFCDVHRFEGTTFNKIISGYYDQYSRPDGFSGLKYLREIRLSYRLLFGDDKRAQDYYRRIARENVECLGLSDPYLDELSISHSNSTSSYSVETDFPILAPRLIELQQYIKRQNPGTLMMLWRDRRDMLRWYTFWVVTIIGGLGIIIALTGLGLAAAQVYYAIPSHSAPSGSK